MKLKNALQLFENLVSGTNEKSEIKIFQEFIQILNSLKEKNLSEAEIQLIETKLDTLELNSAHTRSKKHFSKALKLFKQYLKATFSLTSKGYYTNLGLALGSSFGILFGIVILSRFERSLGIALGISLGMIVGLTIGRNLDAQAKAADKMV